MTQHESCQRDIKSQCFQIARWNINDQPIPSHDILGPMDHGVNVTAIKISLTWI